MTANEDAIERLLIGFPLEPKVLTMLESVSDRPAIAPKGVAGVTLTNLRKRKWIHAIGVGDDGQLFDILPNGRLALKLHVRALAFGKTYRRSRNADTDFQNLHDRLDKLAQISN